MAMKQKFLSANTKCEIIQCREAGGALKSKIGKQCELPTVRHIEEQW
jgi:hypothetical protein